MHEDVFYPPALWLLGTHRLVYIKGRGSGAHRGDVCVVCVAEVNKLPQSVLGEKRERPPRELDAINMIPHPTPVSISTLTDTFHRMQDENLSWGNSRFKNILKMPLSHGRIIRPPNLCHPRLPRLRRPRVMPDEAEPVVLVLEEDFWVLGRRLTGGEAGLRERSSCRSGERRAEAHCGSG